MPKINICLDNTNNDDYTCETFFIPADEADDNDIPKKEEKNNTFNLSLKIPEANSSSNKIGNDNDNQLSNQELLNKYFIDLKFYHEPFSNNYNPKEDLFNITKIRTFA